MGTHGIKLHRWTAEDEVKLSTAIASCEPLWGHYQQQGYSRKHWWDAVAGKLLPDIIVTGAACARRWLIIQERKPTTGDKWDEVATIVSDYEQDTQDWIVSKLDKIDSKLDILLRVWECDLPEKLK